VALRRWIPAVASGLRLLEKEKEGKWALNWRPAAVLGCNDFTKTAHTYFYGLFREEHLIHSSA